MQTSDKQITYYREGHGTPLVLVHGVGASAESWGAVADRLKDRFDIIRPDLRGHGRSAQIDAPITIDTFADDIIRVMDEAGVEKAHLAGFSLGGLITQRLAVGWPDRFERIVILSAVAGRTEEERAKVVARLQMIRDGGMKAITGAARERWFTPEFVRDNEAAILHRIAELEAVHVPSYLEAYRVFSQTELVETLDQIRQPTLVMTGENDVGSNPRMSETMHRLIPNSELEILPRLKHSVLLEAPDLIAEKIGTFLTKTTTNAQEVQHG
ncbi:alpha/beta fold hydrolase [Pseudooceanicola nanhaiensis]|uniref:alpha/beta fold hydrolase n=1 Tax=Pseudooceanicola nanhaiensis TaxID=375761 RepID=UPI001CD628D5|nr:alpha/beta fold hydrolase [Pseudooceanicola nanhaiensis]MCA0918765.1 alpha/beta fold hydrolase [Pseudooceanicola nanhaiensis]